MPRAATLRLSEAPLPLRARDPRLSPLARRLLDCRPTLRSLQDAPNLGTYLAPVLHWGFQPNIFPKARLLLDLIIEEIAACYGDSTARLAADQLQENFTVETGAHISLPRLHDKATQATRPAHNINTLVFQSSLYSAAAHLAAGHRLHISCLTGRITLGNPSSAAYFQPDREHCVRLQSNRWKDAPQCFLPALTAEGIDAILSHAPLTEAGCRRPRISSSRGSALALMKTGSAATRRTRPFSPSGLSYLKSMVSYAQDKQRPGGERSQRRRCSSCANPKGRCLFRRDRLKRLAHTAGMRCAV